MKTKKDCVRHARRRARERYNMEINTSEINRYSNYIKSQNWNKIKFVEKKSLRITIWLIEDEDKQFLVAYDKLRSTIVSFLPNNNEK